MSAAELTAGKGRRAVTPLLSALAFALAPKCPLCVAAWLSALGLGATGAGIVAPLVRPLALALAISAAALFAWTEVKAFRARRAARSRPAEAPSCCRAREGVYKAPPSP